MPPARWTSFICTSDLAGATLHSTGTRHPAAEPVDVIDGEINLTLDGGGEAMQHGVGRSAHDDIQGHRIFKGVLGGDGAGQNDRVILLIIALGDIDDQVPGLDEQPFAVGVGGQSRAVAGRRQPQSPRAPKNLSDSSSNWR